MKACFPCVGLVVFAGCFLLVMSPDDPEQRSGEPAPGVSQKYPVVVIDPGHGGIDEGARGLSGLVEKDVAFDLASRLDGVLRNRGIATVMTRTSDRYVPLSERVAIAEDTGRHVFVSIHLNSKRGSGANGFEVFHAESKEVPNSPWRYAGLFASPQTKPDVEGGALADTVRQEIGSRVATLDRGTRPGRLYVLRHTRGPAILIEAGFIDSPIDSSLLRDNAHRQALATAVADGVVRFMEESRSESGDSTLVLR
jgi:N-acetylmuramoyl-L-alanine amidase